MRYSPDPKYINQLSCYQVETKTVLFGIYRFPGPAQFRAKVAEGDWADLVPIRIINNSNPSVSSNNLVVGLVVGESIRITRRVQIEPALDCLVLTPNPEPGEKSGSKISGSKVSGSKASGSKGSKGSKASGSKTSGSKTSGSKASGSKSLGSKTSESKTSESKT
jgi:hypothetical protein